MFRMGMIRPVARFLQHEHMCRLGIANGMRLAKACYWPRYHRQEASRKDLYHEHFPELLKENGEPVYKAPAMVDGYSIDESKSHPSLPNLLQATDQIISDRGRVRLTAPGTYRSFFQNLVSEADVLNHPAILEFALSSEVLEVVCSYLQMIPSLSRVHPPGIRLAESCRDYDESPDEPHDSQLFHMDYYCTPCVYVIVLLHDVTEEHGPFKFLPDSTSQAVARKLRYWRRGTRYRLQDEAVYSAVSRDEVISFTYPRGTILFIDPSRCFHYGSRNSIQPRYMLMIGYSRILRNEFASSYLAPSVYSKYPSRSRLQKLVLDRDCQIGLT